MTGSIPGGNHIFHLTSKSKIIDHKKGNNNGSWNLETKASNSYTFTLCVPWLESAYGWVSIYSEKRDVKEDKVKSLQIDLADVQSSLTGVQEELDSLDKEISVGHYFTAIAREKLSTVDADIARIRPFSSWLCHEPPNFLVSEHGANLKYFTALGAYAASLGYSLSSTTALSALPKSTSISDGLKLLQDKLEKLSQTSHALAVAFAHCKIAMLGSIIWQRSLMR